MRSRSRGLTWLLVGCCALGGSAWALPDLARGRAALQRGDLAAAEADLRPLAEQGYVEAQVGLARMYAAQDTPEAADKAVQWYRLAAQTDPNMRLPLARSLVRAGAAAKNPGEIKQLLAALVKVNEVEALPLQLRLYREFPQLAEPGRARLLAQQVASSRRIGDRIEAIAWYRDNRAADPSYEKALMSLCERDRETVEECYADLALHFRVAGDADALKKLQAEAIERFGRKAMSAQTLERIARNLSSEDDPGQADVASAYALLARIPEPSPTVLARKARLLILKPSLDPKGDPEAMLKDAYARGSMEAALHLGRMYLDEFNRSADPDTAQKLLREAAPTLSSAHVWLGRMYERGQLGLPEPDKAVDHYLTAARAGHPNADIALARMYSRNRGIRVDPVKAYAFARIAETKGQPAASELSLTLLPAMTQEEIDFAVRLAQAELDARQAALLQQNVPVRADMARAEPGTP